MGQNEGRFLGLLDDVGDGVGFAGTGGAEQGLVPLVLVQSADKLVNRLRLVAGRLEIGYKLKFGHEILHLGLPSL